MAEIYALWSTRDGRVRYVGESGDRLARFKEHAGPWSSQFLIRRWFHHEWRHGYLIRHALLEVCPDDKRYEVEKEWIWRFPRADLLNLRKRRPWWNPTPGSLPRIREIENYRRRHKSNIDGFRGIHYDSHTGYFRVLVYNGDAAWWLKGDELPGGSEAIWFSDLARAVSARDNEQDAYRTLMKSRRREDIIAGHAREQERFRTEQGFIWGD
jgi:hypothetical protein